MADLHPEVVKTIAEGKWKIPVRAYGARAIRLETDEEFARRIALLAAAKAREEERADADRWRYWRNYWPALCRFEVARFAQIDLTRVHVDSPALMDQVTDEAIRRGKPT